ncbi:MAG: DUF2461 domain-containing protein [Christensenellales bacterium]|jgi:uncharacterized protein (TIGR02453 family)
MAFTGFTKRTIEFFMAIAFQNDAEFFNENRSWYKKEVQEPLKQLCAALSPTVLQIDPQVDTRPGRVVSRIRRDTRFSRNKLPYRDHMWLSFRHSGVGIAQSCNYYFEIEPAGAGWGIGFYQATPAQMKLIRGHILARKNEFMRIIKKLDSDKFTLGGDDYKRLPKEAEDAPEALMPWLRKKSFYVHRDIALEPYVFTGGLADVLKADYEQLAPLYRFMRRALREGEEQA